VSFIGFLITLVIVGIVFGLLKDRIAEPFRTFIIIVLLLGFCAWLLDITHVYRFPFLNGAR
jgi:F0F1-type ATP synthase assembly protein I